MTDEAAADTTSNSTTCDSSPLSKKERPKRSKFACHECRRRRVRCDAARRDPPCGNCTATGSECVITPGRDKRKKWLFCITSCNNPQTPLAGYNAVNPEIHDDISKGLKNIQPDQNVSCLEDSDIDGFYESKTPIESSIDEGRFNGGIFEIDYLADWTAVTPGYSDKILNCPKNNRQWPNDFYYEFRSGFPQTYSTSPRPCQISGDDLSAFIRDFGLEEELAL